MTVSLDLGNKFVDQRLFLYAIPFVGHAAKIDSSFNILSVIEQQNNCLTKEQKQRIWVDLSKWVVGSLASTAATWFIPIFGPIQLALTIATFILTIYVVIRVACAQTTTLPITAAHTVAHAFSGFGHTLNE